MKHTIVILAILIIALNTFSQVSQEWVAKYTEPGYTAELPNASIVDGFGNIYVTGYSTDNSSSFFLTLKYDASGTRQWARTYSGPVDGSNVSNVIAIDTRGDIIVSGQSDGDGTNEDIATIKYRPDGRQLWIARFNESNLSVDWPMSMNTDKQGNIYITGTCGDSDGEFLTLKYKSNGIFQWKAKYNGSPGNSDIAYSIALDKDSNVYIVGKSWLNLNICEYAIIKYNNNGAQQWVSKHSGSDNNSNALCRVITDKNRNVYMASSIFRPNSQLDYLTIKFDSLGQQQWEAIFNGAANGEDEATSLAVDDSGNVYVTGFSQSEISNYDCITIKYDENGTQIWTSVFDRGNNGFDRGSRIINDKYGNIYVAGYSESNNSSYDFLTLKYNSTGIQQWMMLYNGSANNTDILRNISLGVSGDVYVTGWTSELNSDIDITTIKYSQLIGIQPVNNQIPKSFSLSQNYPNPFNPATKIKFDIPMGTHRGAFVQLRIYDILGREVTTLVNEQLKPGTYEVKWDGSDYASGVYYYSLITNDYKETKKLILLK